MTDRAQNDRGAPRDGVNRLRDGGDRAKRDALVATARANRDGGKA